MADVSSELWAKTKNEQSQLGLIAAAKKDYRSCKAPNLMCADATDE